MEILVCVKQIRESAEENAGWILNPADACALEAALRLRAETGGRVTVMTMGRPQAKGMLCDLMARGADRSILISDPIYAGSDTLATAGVLAAAIRKEGSYDIVMMGWRAADGETAETPARLSQLLGIPILTDVAELTSAETCVTRCDGVRRVMRFVRPIVLTFREGGQPLRPVSLVGMRRSRNAPLELRTNRELEINPAQCGLAGSPTRVVRMYGSEPALRHLQWLSDGRDVLEALRQAMERPAVTAGSQHDGGRIRGGIWVLCERADADALTLAGRARELTVHEVRILTVSGSNSAAAAERIRQGAPAAVLCVSTGFMRVFAAQTATLLKAGLTADCTALRADGAGQLIQIRPAFGSARMAEILCAGGPQMALVRSGVMPPARPSGVIVEALPPQPDDLRLTCLSEERDADSVDFKEAELVVAGGAGVGSASGSDRLRNLARALGGVCAASRAAVSAGYASYPMQVGQTGMTVRPKAYLAIGISGAIQHLLGMRDSGTVIAVNKDPNAPVFGHADYGLVNDWETTIQEMEACL